MTIGNLARKIHDWLARKLPWWPRYTALLDHVWEIAQVAIRARVCIAGGVVVLLIAALPAQSVEAFRVMAENIGKGSVLDTIAVPLAFTGWQWVLGFVIWVWGRVLLEVTTAEPDRTQTVRAIAVVWIPRIFALMPFLGALIGFGRAIDRSVLTTGFIWMLVVNVTSSVAFILVFRRSTRRGSRSGDWRTAAISRTRD